MQDEPRVLQLGGNCAVSYLLHEAVDPPLLGLHDNGALCLQRHLVALHLHLLLLIM
jgi:hypothetical protein